jgi:hypothetical protein
MTETPAVDDGVAPTDTALVSGTEPAEQEWARTSAEYMAQLEAPIAQALTYLRDMTAKAQAELEETQRVLESSLVPFAVQVGAAFLATKETVKKHGGDWKVMLPAICERQRIKPRSAYDYMLLADPKYRDLSQSSASIAQALRKIAAKRKAEGTQRKSPKPRAKTVQSKTEVEHQDNDQPPNNDGSAAPDLTEHLRNVGPDEVLVALEDADWSRDDLRQLRRGIDEMLGDAPEPLVEAEPANEDVRLATPPAAEPERPSSWFRR